MNRWFPWGIPDGIEDLVLCLPHAGGAASSFRSWRSDTTNNVAFVPIQLPGRETRFSEPLMSNFDEVIDGFTGAIRQLGIRRVSLFGHSMGALLAFESARVLESYSIAVPLIAVSSHSAPIHTGELAPRTSDDTEDEDLLELVREIGGTESEVLQHPALLELFLPRFRADCALLRSYVPDLLGKVRSDILALGGLDDTLVPEASLYEWGELVSGSCEVELFAGGHFYVRDNGASVRSLISTALSRSR